MFNPYVAAQQQAMMQQVRRSEGRRLGMAVSDVLAWVLVLLCVQQFPFRSSKGVVGGIVVVVMLVRLVSCLPGLGGKMEKTKRKKEHRVTWFTVYKHI